MKRGIACILFLAFLAAGLTGAYACSNTPKEDALLEKTAAEFLPAYTYLGGSVSGDTMQLLVDKPDGTRVLICLSGLDDSPVLVESTPLPPGTLYGYENFYTSLVFSENGSLLEGNVLLADVSPHADGTWGVSLIYPFDAAMFFLGPNWVSESSIRFYPRYIGAHPWSDITTIDWDTLPHSLEEARSAVDSTGWAAVCNPNPADRLHLRASPKKDAASYGKYYNGTPVRVLSKNGDWWRVDICGVTGYMMSKYLTEGAPLETNIDAMPQMTFVNESAALYGSPSKDSACTALTSDYDLWLIGILGNDWYHVWDNTTGLSGYIRQDEFWPGNG